MTIILLSFLILFLNW